MYLGIRHILIVNYTNEMLIGYGHFRYVKKTLLIVVTEMRRKNHITSQFMEENECDETNSKE